MSSTVHIELNDDLVALMESVKQPPEAAVRELIAMELYRRGLISSGKAAEVLGMSKIDFLEHAGRLGIPYITMSKEEWDEERTASDRL
jgi:predicted HTH domain antitoxin